MSIDMTKFRGMFEEVKSGAAFNNPLSKIDTSKLTLPSFSELKTEAKKQAALYGLDTPSDDKIIAAQESVTKAYNSTMEMIGHGDRISGVNIHGDSNLITIAKTMQSAKDINGELACDTVMSAFGSIAKAAEMINEVTELGNNIKSFLENIPAQIDALPAAAAALAVKVSDQVLDDVNTFAQAKITVTQFAIAANLPNLFGDPCLGAIMGAVASDNLKREVNKNIEETKKKVSSSIYDVLT
jgi:hypothetical protein